MLAYQFCQIPHLVLAVFYLSPTMVNFLEVGRKEKHVVADLSK